MPLTTFFDIEFEPEKGSILDIGCIKTDGTIFHKNSLKDFVAFIKGSDFVCGHNIISHDLKIIQDALKSPEWGINDAIDTLLWSPLFFPTKPYHSLVKDEKILVTELNNPVNDCSKAKELFEAEVTAFHQCDPGLQQIYHILLNGLPGYDAFFKYLGLNSRSTVDEGVRLIYNYFDGQICRQTDLQKIVAENRRALAYALALVTTNDKHSITPPWVLKCIPEVENILHQLRDVSCNGCSYCRRSFDSKKVLKEYFGYENYRQYNGEPLQEDAVKAAISHKSLLAVFPTGGGKSVTFQIPAIISGINAKALTVVISPLQSLMKDQVDNLERKGLTEAVTINGLLDSIERSKSIERVEDGSACILYISPESLRSVSIERLLLKRAIARFVIDEAHCFSSWGQDFRVDYLYIGDFIKNLQEKKGNGIKIPVSCFTATAKQKVVEDICAYFRDKLGIELLLFRTDAARVNLHYKVARKETDEEKYSELRNIIESKDCPSIVYVSRTKRAYHLAERLQKDGFSAKPYHGKMAKEEKSANQDAFMKGDVKIMVATSAFGMGVDKSDVGTVIHYDISDSLENYVQEAGRAGRDEKIEADCYVLFNEDDLDKHFLMLNQTKLTSKEINQVWRAIKELTRTRSKVSNSSLEIARKAGWDESIKDIETRVVTAIAALEDAGYLNRGQNMPRVFANSIVTKSAQEAVDKISVSDRIETSLKQDTIRVIKKLFSSKSKRLTTEESAESRVDYISDQLGIKKEKTIRIIELLRLEGILANTKDLTAFIKKGENSNRSKFILESYAELELFVLGHLKDGGHDYNLKEINEKAALNGLKDCTVQKLRTLINFWAIKNWVKKHYPEGSKNHIRIEFNFQKEDLNEKLTKRIEIGRITTEYLFKKSREIDKGDTKEEILVEFSVLELKEESERARGLYKIEASLDDIEDTLFYLSRIEAIKIEGGFLVVYNRMTIDRLEANSRIQYKESDYEKLDKFYRQKVQQIHIVGEYAKRMMQNYNEALVFVDDYFKMNYEQFLKKYFKGDRQIDINRSLTPEKFKKLFGELSIPQLGIIRDDRNQYLMVAAGPGSGKTRVLVHKLASLLLTEDIKHEQLLMLTFSRASATEFKKRLIDLIGNAAHFVEIRTFHSFCFDLLGKMGSLEKSEEIEMETLRRIRSGDIERSRITKAVLVIDEAQDINEREFELVTEILKLNEDMRVILVGDDDQNIYAFRGSDSQYMQRLIMERDGFKYELIENFRSKKNLVDFTNQWVNQIGNRLKSMDCISNSKDNGNIEITKYKCRDLIDPLVNNIKQKPPGGSSCILTRTNDEAMLIAGLLQKSGFSARLIQTNDGFSLSNLLELRMFSKMIIGNDEFPIISQENWEKSVRKLKKEVGSSKMLPLAMEAIAQFDLVNKGRKYKSDWNAFLAESCMEDFIIANGGTILVSTIHKAKGREFDNVYLMLDRFQINSDEELRLLYVGMTRARSNLYVHYNGSFLDNIEVENLQLNEDHKTYSEPTHLSMTLTHRDVNLGYYEFVQGRIEGLVSGVGLAITDTGLSDHFGHNVVKYSQEYQEMLKKYEAKGYKVTEAEVNFVVYWKNQETDKEYKVVLPQLFFKK